MKDLILLLLTAASLFAAGGEQGLLILHKGNDSFGFYQLDETHLTAVPVGPHPHEFRFSLDHRYAYITNNGMMRMEHEGQGGNTVSIVDLKERKNVGTISLGEFRRPHAVATHPKTGQVLVTTELPDRLLVIDPVRWALVREYETKGTASHMVVVDRTGEWAYVFNAKSGTVAAIELDSGDLRLIETAGRPETGIVNRDQSKLYVANLDADNITIIDIATKEVVDRIPTGRGPVRLEFTPDEGELVFSLIHGNKTQFIDLAAHKVVAEIELGAQPVSLSLSPDGKLAYASL